MSKTLKIETCLSCKKPLEGITIAFYGKNSCLKCYNEYMNNPKITNK